MLSLDKFKEIIYDFTHDKKTTYKIRATWFGNDINIEQNAVEIEFNHNTATFHDGIRHNIPDGVFADFRYKFRTSHSIREGNIYINKEDVFKRQMIIYIENVLDDIMSKLRRKKSLMPKLSVVATESKINVHLANHQDLVLNMIIKDDEVMQIVKDANSVIKFLKNNNLLVYRK